MTCECGSKEFRAQQRVYVQVIVDERNEFVRDDWPDGKPVVSDAEKPYGPYTCVACGREYEALPKS